MGKSTFLNAVLGEQLAVVSRVPQTTREALLGVAQTPEAQIAFLDTPGLHRPRSELGRRMNASAMEAARATDVLVYMSDVAALARGKSDVQDEDRAILQALPAGTPCLLVLNKVDLIGDKSKLLPHILAFEKLRAFSAIVPVSVQRQDGVERVLGEIAQLLPEGPAGYDPDTLTDKPTLFFVREYIREQILLQAGREVPHAAAVTIDEYDDTGKTVHIKATIHVEKVGQRKILIGSGGERIREIGTLARQRIEQLTGRKVHLSTFVRVTPRWKDVPRMLAEFGYEAHGKTETLPGLEERKTARKRPAKKAPPRGRPPAKTTQRARPAKKAAPRRRQGDRR